MTADEQHEGEGYWFTAIEYVHPYCGPDPDRVSILTWFAPYGLRTMSRIEL